MIKLIKFRGKENINSFELVRVHVVICNLICLDSLGTEIGKKISICD
jgi:hypothetical protein